MDKNWTYFAAGVLVGYLVMPKVWAMVGKRG